MRFVQNWDTLLLSLLASCPTQKAVITSYPPPYELPDKLCDDKRPPLFVATSFDSNGMLRLSGRTLASSPLASVPLPTLFWAAGFNFASSKVLAYGCTKHSPLLTIGAHIHREVPYDPSLEFLFFGEEISMAARLWTAGWDFYAPRMHTLSVVKTAH